MYFGKSCFGQGVKLKYFYRITMSWGKNPGVSEGFALDLIQDLSLLRTKGNIEWPSSFIPLFHSDRVRIESAHLCI